MRRREIPILIAIFLDLLGFGMVVVDIQFRTKALGADGWLNGLILSSMFVTQILVSQRWGRLSDRIGRKPVLLICTFLSANGLVVYAFGDNLWLVLLSRILGGLGAANVAIAQAFLSEATDGETRTGAMGRAAAAVSAGLIVGPWVAATLSGLGHGAWIGGVAAVASGLGLAAIAIGMPTLPKVEATKNGSREKARWIDLTLLRDLPRLRPLILIAVVAWFSLATLEGTFGRLIQATLGYEQEQFGVLFGYESLLSVLVQGVLLVWVTRRIKEASLLRIAYILQGAGLALTPLAPSLAVLFVTSTLYAIGAGFANPTINSLASKCTPDDRQGELFGLLQGARSFGFMVGPALGGLLFDIQPGIPYYFAGAVCVAAAFLVTRGMKDTNPAPLPILGTAWYRFILGLARRALLPLLGGYRVRHRERVPMEGAVLITPVHFSYLDPELVACAMPRAIFFMAKAELFRVPILGALIRSLDAFPVRRGEGDMEAIRKAIEVLKEGRALLMFPEGTRGLGEQMGPISSGVAMLAKRSGAWILPVGIVGTQFVWPKGSKKLRRRRMTVLFGEPFRYDDVAPGASEKVRKAAFASLLGERIAALCQEGGLPIRPPEPQEIPETADVN
ncbi:MAG TPA: MFS transporter [Fimbriimonadaceae bacterium]|nr:MFS transporter [Fimbriimonadaceae bacterium]